MPQLIDVQQASRYLKNVRPNALYKAVARGAIGHWRVGGRIMFTRADLDKLVRYIPPKAN